jgi:hypothetical protein
VKDRATIDNRLTTAGEWLLAGAFFALPLNSLRPVGSVSYGDLFLVAAVAVAFALILLRRRLPQVPWWLWGGAAAVAVSAVVSLVFEPASVRDLEASFANTPDGSPLVECAKLLIGAAVLPVAAATIVRRAGAVNLLVTAWIAGVSLSAVSAVLDAYAGTDIQLALAYDIASVAGFFVIEPARSIGLTVHSNALSLTAVMAAPMLLSRMTSLRNTLIYYPLFLLVLVAVLLSGARAGLIGLAIAVGLTVLLSAGLRRSFRQWRVALTLVVGLAAVAGLVFGLSVKPSSRAAEYYAEQSAWTTPVLLASTTPAEAVEAEPDEPPTIGRFGDSESAAESDRERRQMLEDSIEYISERPLTGYGFRWIESSHNIYLQLLISGGILALIGYLAMVVGYLRLGFRLWDRVPVELAGTASAAFASFALMLMTGLVGNGIVDRYLYLPVALLFAMSFMATRTDEPEAHPAADSDS